MLDLYHGFRNGRRLTVVMFHRVLEPDDPRWRTCDPAYTMDTATFTATLEFFKRHYRLVSQEQVLEARRGGRPLPRRAMLITFDDGWSDNADYALPILQRLGVPALLFVVADAVGRRQPFYQEALVAAWRRGSIKVADLPGGQQGEESLPALRRAITRIETLPEVERDAWLAHWAPALDDGMRHMVDRDDLLRLRDGGLALGLHGKTHVPISRAADQEAELAGARRELAEVLGEPVAAMVSMSFPHGAYDVPTAERARQSGYELAFTSEPVTNLLDPTPSWLLARTGLEQEDVVDRQGRFCPEVAALYLFRLGARRLA